ncbi:hypothetical protein HU200_013702 [Digitaria exilis]|uniref:RNase H type-1 domain-containing protein n=1 Tax=Digitaria exilis TaxID=1010633 RepID=A0A835FC81_9POAL|nr:hypothetical protein HU200_013702 [Digitaria exilis]
MYGLELLKKGIIWRIGSGSQVRIWRDPWIPRGRSLRVTSRQGRCRLRWVSELLDIDGKDWDFDKLARLFNPADADAIAKIKLPARVSEDFLAWHPEKTGLFSVSSAYNLGLSLQNDQTQEASSEAADGERKIWGLVWNGLKLCREALPTRRAKFIRKMETSALCTLCDREAETGFHATVACPQAKCLRKAMREHWHLPEERLFEYTGPVWLLLLLDICSEEQRDLVKLLLWKAWAVHNNITHQSGPLSILESVHSLLALQAPLSLSRFGDGQVSGWKPPPQGYYKVNVDGSYVAQIGEAGVGVIIRDSLGGVILTAWRVVFRCSGAVEAEARACVEGLRLAAQWAQGPVILESDCARIVGTLQKKEDSWSIVQVKRECNSVANNLAHLARRNVHSAVWLGQAPACATVLIKSDCNLPSS